MPETIRNDCRNTDQDVPETPGKIIRCILESFALERIESLTGKQYERLHRVGDGIHNELLCQYTANVLAREVWTGPSEAGVNGHST
ncbi:FGGY-family carbohydrate kinase [Bacillus swezeyi]|uniref:FGGY-family carbohydrate kinase n=1 Tax=Bacillus swezeyi TaxID=1925020 RepID=UPI0039C60EFF